MGYTVKGLGRSVIGLHRAGQECQWATQDWAGVSMGYTVKGLGRSVNGLHS